MDKFVIRSNDDGSDESDTDLPEVFGSKKDSFSFSHDHIVPLRSEIMNPPNLHQ